MSVDLEKQREYRRLWMQEWRKKNPEKFREAARRRYAQKKNSLEFMERRRAQARKYYAKTAPQQREKFHQRWLAYAEKRRHRRLEIMYGLTNAEYEVMFKAQNGLCAICQRPETRIDRRSKKVTALVVDHNHNTGKIRALLCNRCNAVIGQLAENPEYLEAAKQYLLHHNG